MYYSTARSIIGDVRLGPMSNGRVSQAVILAGGRGTRLLPLTKDLPKPMIEFQGKPFLEYLIELLKEQGVQRVLFLLGYLPEKITEYFGDGSDWGLRIDYQVSDVDDETGMRIKLAAERIDERFLLLYCDNYWPLPLRDMEERFEASQADALVTVYGNKDNYTKSNLRIGADGFIECYDKTHSASGLQGVDIGFLILKKSVLKLIPDGNVSFEKNVYPQLIAHRRIVGYQTDHRYYSVGDHRRLSLTDEFFSPKKFVLLDRDGVLNRKAPKADYVKIWGEFEWLPEAKKGLALLKSKGYKIALITNQAGIARGMMSEGDLDEIHSNMIKEARDAGGDIDAIYYCPHGWDDGCECRKPKPGMLFQAQKDYGLDLSKTLYIGDDPRDAEAGSAAGCQMAIVSENRSLLNFVEKI